MKVTVLMVPLNMQSKLKRCILFFLIELWILKPKDSGNVAARLFQWKHSGSKFSITPKHLNVETGICDLFGNMLNVMLVANYLYFA